MVYSNLWRIGGRGEFLDACKAFFAFFILFYFFNLNFILFILLIFFIRRFAPDKKISISLLSCPFPPLFFRLCSKYNPSIFYPFSSHVVWIFTPSPVSGNGLVQTFIGGSENPSSVLGAKQNTFAPPPELQLKNLLCHEISVGGAVTVLGEEGSKEKVGSDRIEMTLKLLFMKGGSLNQKRRSNKVLQKRKPNWIRSFSLSSPDFFRYKCIRNSMRPMIYANYWASIFCTHVYEKH